ncbi:uncharacterized protein LOC126678349 [Mercurialis annua]|uniref:uncharacterized protein LOC126678349 n=1 Tax=Mercurialis annua TaxID=3986 RepID=UPI002160BA3A|nr:uncharacterized protein LOC126678349 [Mercurialis annua]
MGVRKGINKYYPPEFDASKLPRRRGALNDAMKVRMMLPMSIRCNSCGNYIYKGTKFDMIKEIAQEKYLNIISIHRFYLKCTHCKAEIMFKTDPQHSDYVVEIGASRNFEAWRDECQHEEMDDAMKLLENKSLDNKRRMRIENQLDELQRLKCRQAKVVGSETLLHVLADKKKKLVEEEEEDDESLVKSIFGQRFKVLIRLREDEDEDTFASFST